MRSQRRPSSVHERLLDAVGVPLGEHRARQQDAAVVVDPDGDAVQRDAVVHAPAAGLGHAVGGDDPDARATGRGPAASAPVAAPPTSTASNVRRASVPAGSSSRRTSCVGTSDVYRGPSTQRGRRRHEGRRAERAVGDDDGSGAREHRPDQDLQPGDVLQRQREQPVPRTGQPVGRRGGRGAQRGRREQDRRAGRRSSRTCAPRGRPRRRPCPGPTPTAGPVPSRAAASAGSRRSARAGTSRRGRLTGPG